MNYRHRFENNKKLHYQIDISVGSIDGLSMAFIKSCLANRVLVDDLYYVLPVSHEAVFRAMETRLNPHKKHHWEYLKAHEDEVDLGLLQLAGIK
jgi:hypothetical protein